MKTLKKFISAKVQIFSVVGKVNIFLEVARIMSIFFRKISYRCYLLPLILLVSLESYAETREYLNRYRELYTGVTPIYEMLEYLGDPDEIIGSKDNVHYFYQNLYVTALKSTGRIDSITIIDRSYIDPNGMSISSHVLELMEVVGEKKEIRPTDVSEYWDTNKGIIYKFNQFGLVAEIVLKSSMPVFDGGGNQNLE